MAALTIAAVGTGVSFPWDILLQEQGRRAAFRRISSLWLTDRFSLQAQICGEVQIHQLWR